MVELFVTIAYCSYAPIIILCFILLNLWYVQQEYLAGMKKRIIIVNTFTK